MTCHFTRAWEQTSLIFCYSLEKFVVSIGPLRSGLNDTVLNWVHNYQYNEKSEFVGYEQPTGETFPGVESWFLACVPNSSFIKEWRDEFLSSLSFSSTKQYIATLQKEGINIDKCLGRSKKALPIQR